jgi:hypothetical protein
MTWGAAIFMRLVRYYQIGKLRMQVRKKREALDGSLVVVPSLDKKAGDRHLMSVYDRLHVKADRQALGGVRNDLGHGRGEMLNGLRRDLPFAMRAGEGYEVLRAGVHHRFTLTLSDALLSP